MQKLALSIPEVCEALSISRTSVYALLADARLTRIKLGRRTLVTMESVQSLVNTPSSANEKRTDGALSRTSGERR